MYEGIARISGFRTKTCSKFMRSIKILSSLLILYFYVKKFHTVTHLHYMVTNVNINYEIIVPNGEEIAKTNLTLSC